MNKTLFEKIEQYLNGEMSAEERVLFEYEMKTNDELSSACNTYKLIETQMRNQEKNSENETLLKDSLQKLNAVYFEREIKNSPDIQNTNKALPVFDASITEKFKAKNNKRSIVSIWKTIGIAAATIGIIALSFIWYLYSTKEKEQVAVNVKKTDTEENINRQDTTGLQKNIALQNNTDTNTDANKNPNTLTKKKQEALFATNFKPDVTPENKEGPLEDAFDYYDDHNYAGAAEEFSSANLNTITRGLDTNPKLTAFYAHYYGGLSYLAEGTATEAITELKNAIAKSPAELFKIKAQWYLALAYLKTGEIKKANELLSKISVNEKETEYKSKSIKLLNELK